VDWQSSFRTVIRALARETWRADGLSVGTRGSVVLILLLLMPGAACANPIALDGGSLIAFPIVAFAALVVKVARRDKRESR